MTEQVLKVFGKLDEQSTQSIIWVTLEQAKLINYLAYFHISGKPLFYIPICKFFISGQTLAGSILAELIFKHILHLQNSKLCFFLIKDQYCPHRSDNYFITLIVVGPRI